MHYAKVVGIFQTLHPGRTTISVLQGLGYFSPPPFLSNVLFHCVGAVVMSYWGWLGGQGITARPLVPTELSKVGIHQMEEQQADPTCIFGCRKNLWGWRGAKNQGWRGAGSGDVSHGQLMLRQQPGWEAHGMVAPSHWGLGQPLAYPGLGKALQNMNFFQQISLATGSSHWESSAHHHSLGSATTERLGWSWRRWGHTEPPCPVPPGAQRQREG